MFALKAGDGNSAPHGVVVSVNRHIRDWLILLLVVYTDLKFSHSWWCGFLASTKSPS